MEGKYPSYMETEPTCCKEHKLLFKRKRHIDVSGWTFLPKSDCLHAKKFNPYSRETPTSESRSKGMEELEEELEKALFETAEESFREIPPTKKENLEEILETTETADEAQSISVESTKEEILDSYKGKIRTTNPYLTLLNKLDEEEGKRAPSIEDKLKLAENRLRVSMMEFCKHSTRLATMKEGDKEADDEADRVSQSELFIQPETIQELFRPQVFDLSPCPPVPFEVKEMEAPQLLVRTKTKLQEKEWRKKEAKMQVKFKQGYYLPPDTWFSPDTKEAVSISPEEIDLFNSFSTKEFLKFLEERKKEPPKALKRLQEKIKQLQRSINEPETKHRNKITN